MVALSMMLSVRRCMAAKAGLLEAVGGKLGLCVALYCCWPSLAACATKEADFLAILSKNGFSYVCFTYRGSGQTSSPGVQAEMIFRRCRTFLALDTSAEWSNPSKGFQHRGMIPVLGTASLGDAIEFTGGPGFDPRFGPERSNFFCPGGLHATQDRPMRPRATRPPYAPAEPRASSNALAVAPVRTRKYTRPPLLVCGRDSRDDERAIPPRKIQDPQI